MMKYVSHFSYIFHEHWPVSIIFLVFGSEDEVMGKALSQSNKDNFLGAYKLFKEDVYIHGPIAYEGRLVFRLTFFLNEKKYFSKFQKISKISKKFKKFKIFQKISKKFKNSKFKFFSKNFKNSKFKIFSKIFKNSIFFFKLENVFLF